MKRLLQLLFLFSFVSFAQMPTYYGSIDLDQNGIDLEIDLSQLIRETHTTLLPYTSSQPDTWDAVNQSVRYFFR